MKIANRNSKIDAEFFRVVEEMVEKKKDASVRYGDKVWNSLGAQGLFADINRKYGRIKHVIWDKTCRISSEKFEDTCFDLAVYSLLMIMSHRRVQKSCRKKGRFE